LIDEVTSKEEPIVEATKATDQISESQLIEQESLETTEETSDLKVGVETIL
jgi:hypothetical protein